MAARDRQIDQRKPRHARQLCERAVQVRDRQVFEHVRRDHDVELAIREHGHVVHAAKHIGTERVVDVKGRHLVSPPLEHVRVKSLPGADDQQTPGITAALDVTILVVGVREVRQVELALPRGAVHGHHGGSRGLLVHGTVSPYPSKAWRSD